MKGLSGTPGKLWEAEKEALANPSTSLETGCGKSCLRKYL
jgi:hypothetical protein